MLVEKWKQAKKPLMIVGNGVRLSGGVNELHQILNNTRIPTIVNTAMNNAT